MLAWLDKALQDRPLLLMLIGLPASGKSTLREEILKEHGDEFIVVSSDQAIEDYAVQNSMTYDEARGVFSTSQMLDYKQVLVDKALAEGKSVIWDETNLWRRVRRQKMEMLPGYKTLGAYFPLSLDDCKTRVLERAASENGKNILGSVLTNMASSMEEPQASEFDEFMQLSVNKPATGQPNVQKQSKPGLF